MRISLLPTPAFPEKQPGHTARTSISTKYLVFTKYGDHKMSNSNPQLKM
jgi:hypothetical protein